VQTERTKREVEVYRTAFEKEKVFTDWALKLAKEGKPKSNWELRGILGMAVFSNSPRTSILKSDPTASSAIAVTYII